MQPHHTSTPENKVGGEFFSEHLPTTKRRRARTLFAAGRVRRWIAKTYKRVFTSPRLSGPGEPHRWAVSEWVPTTGSDAVSRTRLFFVRPGAETAYFQEFGPRRFPRPNRACPIRRSLPDSAGPQTAGRHRNLRSTTNGRRSVWPDNSEPPRSGARQIT